MSRPLVSVIVPHYENLDGLAQCLRALEFQHFDRACFEIIVSDNDSPAGETAVRRIVSGRARLVTVIEKGAGPARNGGVGVAKGQILAFTDSDCLPDPNWLASGVRGLKQYNVVGGPIRVKTSDARPLDGAEAYEMLFAFHNEKYIKRKGFTVTANLFCSKDVFNDVGGFRSGVPEDLDWCRRAAMRGYRLGFVGDAVVTHPARRGWSQLKAKWRRLNREAYQDLVPGRLAVLKWLARCTLYPISIMPHLFYIIVSRENVDPVSRAKAALMLVRLRSWRTMDCIRLCLSNNAT